MITICPRLTSSSSSTQGVKSCKTIILLSEELKPLDSFSRPTLTSVSMEADPVILPGAGARPSSISSSVVKNDILMSQSNEQMGKDERGRRKGNQSTVTPSINRLDTSIRIFLSVVWVSLLQTSSCITTSTRFCIQSGEEFTLSLSLD